MQNQLKEWGSEEQQEHASGFCTFSLPRRSATGEKRHMVCKLHGALPGWRQTPVPSSHSHGMRFRVERLEGRGILLLVSSAGKHSSVRAACLAAAAAAAKVAAGARVGRSSSSSVSSSMWQHPPGPVGAAGLLGLVLLCHRRRRHRHRGCGAPATQPLGGLHLLPEHGGCTGSQGGGGGRGGEEGGGPFEAAALVITMFPPHLPLHPPHPLQTHAPLPTFQTQTRAAQRPPCPCPGQRRRPPAAGSCGRRAPARAPAARCADLRVQGDGG